MTHDGIEILRDAGEVRAWRDAVRQTRRTVGFVPTMGALHAGHTSLVERARREADVVIASIYVNPTQFDRAEDLANYPRDPEGDRAMLAAAGCDAVFEPATLYGPHHATWVEVPALAEHLCGATRPGHFRGVATIVTKLLNLVAPEVAVFGAKDFQQVAIIQRMVADLDMPVRIVSSPTIRESDGLAMSSRNRRLSASERAAAVTIHAGLTEAQAMFAGGEQAAGRLVAHVAQRIVAAGGRLDYVAAVNPEDLVPLAAEGKARPDSHIAVAAFFGAVRLIDHVALGGG